MKPTTILLVDDDPNSITITKYIFRKAHIQSELKIVKSGEDAVAYLSGKGNYSNRRLYPRPDLVLLDLYMPGMSGFEVLSWIRNQKEFQELPVIILTSSYDSDDIQRCYELGANNYLLKPISVNALKEIVDIYIEPVITNPKILIIDDDADIRKLAITQLKKKFPGIQITEVGLPEELEPAFEQGGYDLIITDYDLKWDNGLKILRAMKTRWPRCPVIMCTGSGSEEIVMEALRSGIDDYILKKPKHFVRLASAVRLALARSKHLKDAIETSVRYRDLYERVPIGLFRYSLGGMIIDANPAFLKILGLSQLESLKSINFKKLFEDENDLKKFEQFIGSKKDILSFEAKLKKESGTVVWGDIKIYSIKDDQGNIIHYEGTLIDITERKNLELQLRQASKMEAIGLFVGGIAHDFNNILTSLIGYATLLQMKVDEENPLRFYIDQIILASNKAANLTQNLLSFSRKKPSKLEIIDVNKHINSTIKLLKRLLTEEIILNTSFSEEELFIMADAAQLDQVLLNLVSNARDAMPHGGVITIATEKVKIDNIYDLTLSFGEAGEYAGIYVSDTGIGIDKETKERIFEPFFTTKDVGKGTGLGLFTVYGIVKQHKGCIDIKSNKSEGTIFKVFFPLTGQIHETEEPSIFQETQKGREKILLAEDDKEVQALMVQILSDFGYEVFVASDGEEAIETFKKHNDIDLLIFDLIMPKKKGVDAYEVIKKINPLIKVIFISGYADNMIHERNLDDKEVFFISKPINPKILLQKIRDVLS